MWECKREITRDRVQSCYVSPQILITEKRKQEGGRERWQEREGNFKQMLVVEARG
jgi:hypothetical protein